MEPFRAGLGRIEAGLQLQRGVALLHADALLLQALQKLGEFGVSAAPGRLAPRPVDPDLLLRMIVLERVEGGCEGLLGVVQEVVEFAPADVPTRRGPRRRPKPPRPSPGC